MTWGYLSTLFLFKNRVLGDSVKPIATFKKKNTK